LGRGSGKMRKSSGRRLDLGNLRAAGQDTIRDINQTILLNFIRYRTPISRAAIAAATGLQRSTVSIIVDHLIRERMVYEVRAQANGRGRVPTFLYLNPDYLYIIGVDVGLMETTIALSDFTGRILEQERIRTDKNPFRFTKMLLSALRPFAENARSRSRLDAIGVAVPGLVDTSGKVLLAPNLGWKDFDLASPVQDVFQVPVHVENVSKSSALALLWQADLESVRSHDYVYVYVTEGIGTGLIIDGQLHKGIEGIAGEFGHMVIDPQGPPCKCGNRGCWEVLADNRSALRRYAQKRPRRSRRALTIQELVALANSGDRRARAAIRETAEFLALGIGNILAGLNPEYVIIDGELTKAWDILDAVMKKSLLRGVFGLEYKNVKIIPPPLKEKPSLVGAISLALSGHFAPAALH